MLGIRCFKDCSVDIWVGDSEQFAADQYLYVNAHAEIDSLVMLDGKHIALQWNDSLVCEASLKALLPVLEKGPVPRRITFILENKKLYPDMRNFLETVFEDIA